MGHYAAGAFNVNYLNNSYVEGESDHKDSKQPKPKIVPKPHHLHAQKDKHLFPNLAKDNPADSEQLTAYKKVLKNVTLVRTSMWGYCFDFCNNKRRQRRLNEAVMS